MRRRITVGVCVCVSGSIFPNSNESAKKSYGSPQCCSRLIYNVFFFVKQPLREDTEFEWQPCWSTILLDLTGAQRIFIHLTLLSTTWCFVYITGFAIVFGATLYTACTYLHWTFTSTTCNHSPEGRYDPI